MNFIYFFVNLMKTFLITEKYNPCKILTVMLFNLDCKRRKWNLVICDEPRPLNLWLLLQKPWRLLVHQRPCTMMRLRSSRRPYISFRMIFWNWGLKNSNPHTMQRRLVLTCYFTCFSKLLRKTQIIKSRSILYVTRSRAFSSI